MEVGAIGVKQESHPQWRAACARAPACLHHPLLLGLPFLPLHPCKPLHHYRQDAAVAAVHGSGLGGRQALKLMKQRTWAG